MTSEVMRRIKGEEMAMVPTLHPDREDEEVIAVKTKTLRRRRRRSTTMTMTNDETLSRREVIRSCIC